MKKLLLILLCLPLLFTTCKKEEEEPTNSGDNNIGNTAATIIGKWNVMTQEDDYIEVSSLGDTAYANETYTFGVDEGLPSFLHLEFLVDEQIKITSNNDGELITVFAPYYINGVELYITSNEWPFDAGELNTIILLNNTNLHFAVPASASYAFGEQRFFCERM
jgi:hypothetical protein